MKSQSLLIKQKVPTPDSIWDSQLEQAVSFLESNQTFLFSADIDPDSVGSMLSMALYLRLMNKKVYLIIPGPLGENLGFLERIILYNSIPVLRNVNEVDEIKETVDAVVFCDTANTNLVPFFPYLWEHFLVNDLPVLEIDHHFGADSEEISDYSVTLFRKTNATTEIIAELLRKLHQNSPKRENPFARRNILISLLTGILGDTGGGEDATFRKIYDYWVSTLGDCLQKYTWDTDGHGSASGDRGKLKFRTPEDIAEYMNRLSDEQKTCLKTLKKRIIVSGSVNSLNLLNSNYPQLRGVCRPFHTTWFLDILAFLLNQITDKSAKVGMVFFHGKNAEDKDCIYIKMRRSSNYKKIDLRQVEEKIRSIFDGKYMGGGGHPGAVSFRVHPHDEEEFLAKFDIIVNSLKKSLV